MCVCVCVMETGRGLRVSDSFKWGGDIKIQKHTNEHLGHESGK